MTVKNKRKSRSSMSPQSTQPKRRHSGRTMPDTTTPGAFPLSPTPPPAYSATPPVLAPFLERHPRPPRWRKSHAEARQPVLDPVVLESIYRTPPPDPEPVQRYGLRSQQQRRQVGIEVRISFSQPVDEDNPAPKTALRRNIFQEAQEARASVEDPEVVNRSFSNLSFDQDTVVDISSPPRARSSTSTNSSRPPPVPHATKAKATEAWARQISQQVRSRIKTPQAEPVPVPRMPTIPELSKPKREGYGFSFSDTDFYDSDEYPDTEAGSDHTVTPGFMSVPECDPTIPNSSFDDLVVVRDVGSFHLARPQRRLPCTTATREDTVRIKVAAKNLLKYKESQDVYAALVGRLECMVQNSLRENGGDTSAAMLHCASKLLHFLQKMAMERVEHGEVTTFVAHEIQWAKWLVEASHSGVMHLRGPGCQCRPEWEEDEEEE